MSKTAQFAINVISNWINFGVAALVGAIMIPYVSGHLGDARFSLRGSVEDLAVLGHPDLVVSAEGPEIGTITGLFDLPAPGRGPFRLEGRAKPSPSGVEVALDAALGGLAAEVGGSVRSPNARSSPSAPSDGEISPE